LRSRRSWPRRGSAAGLQQGQAATESSRCSSASPSSSTPTSVDHERHRRTGRRRRAGRPALRRLEQRRRPRQLVRPVSGVACSSPLSATHRVRRRGGPGSRPVAAWTPPTALPDRTGRPSHSGNGSTAAAARRARPLGSLRRPVAVDAVSFQIHSGEIVGRSARTAGKSSLMTRSPDSYRPAVTCSCWTSRSAVSARPLAPGPAWPGRGSRPPCSGPDVATTSRSLTRQRTRATYCAMSSPGEDRRVDEPRRAGAWPWPTSYRAALDRTNSARLLWRGRSPARRRCCWRRAAAGARSERAPLLAERLRAFADSGAGVLLVEHDLNWCCRPAIASSFRPRRVIFAGEPPACVRSGVVALLRCTRRGRPPRGDRAMNAIAVRDLQPAASASRQSTGDLTWPPEKSCYSWGQRRGKTTTCSRSPASCRSRRIRRVLGKASRGSRPPDSPRTRLRAGNAACSSS